MPSVPLFPIVADALLRTTRALPAAGASNSHASIDLGQTSQFSTNTRLALEVAIPATPALADTKSVTLTVEDSADNVTFVAVPELAPMKVTGAGGVGAAAATLRFPLPGTLRRYLRATQVVDAAGGTNTAITSTVQLLALL